MQPIERGTASQRGRSFFSSSTASSGVGRERSWLVSHLLQHVGSPCPMRQEWSERASPIPASADSRAGLVKYEYTDWVSEPTKCQYSVEMGLAALLPNA